MLQMSFYILGMLWLMLSNAQIVLTLACTEHLAAKTALCGALVNRLRNVKPMVLLGIMLGWLLVVCGTKNVATHGTTIGMAPVRRPVSVLTPLAGMFTRQSYLL